MSCCLPYILYVMYGREKEINFHEIMSVCNYTVVYRLLKAAITC